MLPPECEGVGVVVVINLMVSSAADFILVFDKLSEVVGVPGAVGLRVELGATSF